MEVQPAFGRHLRECREKLQERDGAAFSLRAVARRLECQPAYISMIERGACGPPAEPMIKKLANILEEDPDALLALAGKVSSDLRTAILKRRRLFASLIRQLREAPEETICRVVREVYETNG